MDLPLVLNSGGRKTMYTEERNIEINKNGQKLADLKSLFRTKRCVNDFAVAMAVIGFILMLVENELYMHHYTHKSDKASYRIKGCISLTTIVLLCLILLYHVLDMKLFLLKNCLGDWLLIITWQRLLWILVELIICGIHPIPGDYRIDMAALGKSQDLRHEEFEISIDVLLAFPMFLRIYLVCRALTLHNSFMKSSSCQVSHSLATINVDKR